MVNFLDLSKVNLLLPGEMAKCMCVLNNVTMPCSPQDSVIILVHTHRFKLELKINRTNKFPQARPDFAAPQAPKIPSKIKILVKLQKDIRKFSGKFPGS